MTESQPLQRVGVYGASGYAGQDVVRILAQHPHVEIAFATSDNYAGEPVPATDLQYIPHDDASLSAVDVVFLALPHGASARRAATASAHGVKVIDLSADLRLDSAESYQRWYSATHPHPALLATPYGLVEVNRALLHGVDMVAVPGCYPTATLLGLYPLLRAGVILPDAPIIVDAKSGVTGAGRAPKPHLHFPEVYGNLTPYAAGRAHRHVGEIEQEIGKLDADAGALIFTPHLVAVDRGLMTSIYVHLKPDFPADDAPTLYRRAYDAEPFIDVLPDGAQASFKHVVHTNHCAISLTPVNGRYLHITSVIDNLVKGAAGQAVQNFNLMCGFAETAGLC
ncbi:MAG: N-acetyl-gamma-glutamyl-phosphate reductase [Anaerolineaceae bacterium]|nr:MAG: N-acetyl-gamma-glutamyl-phosphate reductase [Anaerolineaceae bacterium]